MLELPAGGNAEQEGYKQQVAFNQWLLRLGCFDFSGYGPSPEMFYAGLRELGLSLEGMQSKGFSLSGQEDSE